MEEVGEVLWRVEGAGILEGGQVVEQRAAGVLLPHQVVAGHEVGEVRQQLQAQFHVIQDHARVEEPESARDIDGHTNEIRNIRVLRGKTVYVHNLLYYQFTECELLELSNPTGEPPPPRTKEQI